LKLEFDVLLSTSGFKFNLRRYSVAEVSGSAERKPSIQVPAGFNDSASALPLRKSFEAFAAFGRGRAAAAAAETLAGRDW